MKESLKVGVSYNAVLLIKHFTWHTSWYDPLLYKKIVEVCWASVINVKYVWSEAVTGSF